MPKMPKGLSLREAAQYMASFRAGASAGKFEYEASRKWTTAERNGYSDGIASNKRKVY
jgi:hypothetical protein